MKPKPTKRTWFLIILGALTLSVSAQDEINTEFINRMNYVFSPVEKNRVPNGLLLDYAMEFADVKSYNGVLTDSNKVNAGLLRDIYTTIAMSAIHSNAGGLYSPDYVDSIWQLQRQPDIITLSGLYYNYSRLRDDAVNAGLIMVSNDQLYDRYVNGVWQNPYQAETVFAMSPPLHAYSGKNFQVVLPSNLWLTNNAHNGEAGQSWITVDYANADLRLRRPLIVVEGFDPGHLLTPEVQFGFSDFNSFLLQLDGSASLQNLLQGTTQQYDIIYVDWFRGTHAAFRQI